MIVVTGATGSLGRLIVHALHERLPAVSIGVSVRDPHKAEDWATRGVRVRRGDFAEPSTLPHAFEGADTLLLVSSNARASRQDPLVQHRAVIAAAQAAGVRRIVYTSQIAASHTSHFAPARDHAATEDMLRASGLAWTALRNGFYAQSGLALIAEGLAAGVLAAPADGKVSWTTHEDLAACAASFLVDDSCASGPTPPLTAAAAFDLAEIAALASRPNRAVRREVISDDAFRAKYVARGAPAAAAEFALGLYGASRAGEFAAVDPTLEARIARRPMGLDALLNR
jgi:uncharacterized protein YbjT (DUF2867 family)